MFLIFLESTEATDVQDKRAQNPSFRKNMKSGITREPSCNVSRERSTQYEANLLY